MQIYSKNNKNCFFSLISLPIFILFVLSDRARVGASKLVHKILKFINYANLCKFIPKKMLRTSFLNPFWFGLLYLIELIGGFWFWFGLLYLIELIGGLKFFTQNSKIH